MNQIFTLEAFKTLKYQIVNDCIQHFLPDLHCDPKLDNGPSFHEIIHIENESANDEKLGKTEMSENLYDYCQSIKTELKCLKIRMPIVFLSQPFN